MEKHNNRGERPQRGARIKGLHKLSIRWPGVEMALILHMLDREEARETVRRLEREGASVEWNDYPYSTYSDADIAVHAALDWKRHAPVQVPGAMTEAKARELAAGDRHYVARPDRVGDGWHVWDSVSDHRVEFQEKSNG